MLQTELVIKNATGAQIQAVMAALNGDTVLGYETNPPATAPTTARKTRKPKENAETFELAGRETGGSSGEFGETALNEMDAEEQAETEAEVTQNAENEQPPLDLKDVIGACKAHASKHGKAATMKIITNFKVKSVQDLKPAQYQGVVSALSK